MKKNVFKLLGLCALLLGLTACGTALQPPREAIDSGPDTPTASDLIGTWEWDQNSGYVYVFNEDGTGERGFAPFRRSFQWEIVGGELRIRRERWQVTLVDDVLTITSLQVANMEYHYIRR